MISNIKIILEYEFLVITGKYAINLRTIFENDQLLFTSDCFEFVFVLHGEV